MYALWYCKSMESRCKADALAKSLLQKDDAMFWKTIKKVTNKCEIQSEEINGAVGEPAIADMWSKNYSKILNSNKDIQYKPSVLDKM